MGNHRFAICIPGISSKLVPLMSHRWDMDDGTHLRPWTANGVGMGKTVNICATSGFFSKKAKKNEWPKQRLFIFTIIFTMSPNSWLTHNIPCWELPVWNEHSLVIAVFWRKDDQRNQCSPQQPRCIVACHDSPRAFGGGEYLLGKDHWRISWLLKWSLLMNHYPHIVTYNHI